MPFAATSRVNVLEPTVAVDDYGDEVETWRTVATDVGAHVWERTRRAFSAVDSRWTVARELRAFLTAGTELAQGVRLEDCATGAVYTVVHVYDHDASPVGVVPTRVDLERITS